MQFILKYWESLAWSIGILGGSIAVALVVRSVIFAAIRRFLRKEPTLLKGSLISHSERLARWILPLLAVTIALPAAPLPSAVVYPLRHAIGLAFIASVAWLAILGADVVLDMLGSHYRVDIADNLTARKVHTQLRVLRRIVVSVVTVVAISVMLMTFPEIRQIGASLLASAGLAGLIVGVAMKPSLSSLLAGIQIALTEPIRIDDVVVVEDEWGWIEEIQTTYVVVRLWDLRRLILPLSYFIEKPFQNWTRSSANLLANVTLWIDYTAPVEELRQELTRILKSTNKWRGQVNNLQVTDASDHAIQIRAVMDAADSGQAWDLRCDVREKLIQFLQQRYPQCLPRARQEEVGAQENRAPVRRRSLATSAGGG
jgi:small-conductance mechanosensitive channel